MTNQPDYVIETTTEPRHYLAQLDGTSLNFWQMGPAGPAVLHFVDFVEAAQFISTQRVGDAQHPIVRCRIIPFGALPMAEREAPSCGACGSWHEAGQCDLDPSNLLALPCAWCGRELYDIDGGSCPACKMHTCIECGARLVINDDSATGPLDVDDPRRVIHYGTRCTQSVEYGWTALAASSDRRRCDYNCPEQATDVVPAAYGSHVYVCAEHRPAALLKFRGWLVEQAEILARAEQAQQAFAELRNLHAWWMAVESQGDGINGGDLVEQVGELFARMGWPEDSDDVARRMADDANLDAQRLRDIANPMTQLMGQPMPGSEDVVDVDEGQLLQLLGQIEIERQAGA